MRRRSLPSPRQPRLGNGMSLSVLSEKTLQRVRSVGLVQRRRRREHHRAFSAHVRFAGPDSDAPTAEPMDTLNLDCNGKPLTYASAKRGPDRLAWERAEAEEIIRLILTGTIFPIPHSLVPKDR
jgi:hypothetical protein